MSELVIEVMTPVDLDVAVGWALAEGWNPGRRDAEAFLATDPGGFLKGVVDGEMVAAISVVAYDDSFGFLGFYIVAPQWRGSGFGLRIWEAGLRRLGERNVGLDGVVAQQENYKKFGFKLAHRNIRYRMTGRGNTVPDPAIAPLQQFDPVEIDAYDRMHFPAPRPAFLERWLALEGRVSLGFSYSGRLCGMGTIRPAADGWRIGPLFANDGAIARCLLGQLASHAGGEPVYIDMPDVNHDAVRLAEEHDMEVVFETARMYSREAPALPVGSIYGITTFELG